VTGASLSPDGSIAAFLDASDAGTTFQVERSSGIGNSPACSDTYLLGTPVWSPDGSRVAVACASRVLILDLASDVFTPFDLQDRQPVALSWTEDGNHLLAATFYQALGSGSPAVGHRSIAVDSLDTTTGSWTAVARPVDPSIDWTTVGDTDRGQGFAPDGRHLLMGTFVVDLATSAVQTVVPNQALGWTLDGSAITSVVESESPSVNLRVQRQSLSDQAPSGVGILPYSAGQLLHSGSDLMSIALELP
jgi:hypothetical protein